MKVISQTLSREFETLNLYVLADAHIGSPNCNYKQIDKFINEVLSKENNYVILNGDLAENCIEGSKSDIYTQALSPMDQIKEIARILKPIKNRILGAVYGNHEQRSYRKTGLDMTYLALVELLGSEKANRIYAKDTCLLFVEFGRNNGRNNRRTIYSIFFSHGTSGGGTVGGKANRLDKMSNIMNADVFIHSHTHMPLVFKQNTSNVDYRNKKLNQKTSLFVNSNAFLVGGYAEAWFLKSPSIDYPHIILNGSHREVLAVL